MPRLEINPVFVTPRLKVEHLFFAVKDVSVCVCVCVCVLVEKQAGAKNQYFCSLAASV